MSSKDERRARGKQVFEEVYGGVVPLPPNSDSSGFMQLAAGSDVCGGMVAGGTVDP